MFFSKKLIDSKNYINELGKSMQNETTELHKKMIQTLNYLGNHKNDLRDMEGIEIFKMFYPIIETYNAVKHTTEERVEMIANFCSLLISSKVERSNMIQTAHVSSKKYLEAIKLYDNNSTLVRQNAMKAINVITAINEICDVAIKLKTKLNNENKFIF